MKKNPIFQIISLDPRPFSNAYTITKKTAQSGKSYFLFKPKAMPLSKQDDTFHLNDWHISIYEDLTKDEGHGEASYHVTINFSNSSNKKIFARAYFNYSNNLLYINYKDPRDKLIDALPSETHDQAIQLAQTYSIDFYNLIWDIYSQIHEKFSKQYEKLISQLSRLSRNLQTSQRDVLVKYQTKLDEIIRHIDKWMRFELCPNIGQFKYLKSLQQQINQRIIEIDTTPLANNKLETSTKELEVIAEISTSNKMNRHDQSLQELNTINTQLKELENNKLLLNYQKITLEHELLSKKFDLPSENNDVLECALRINKLEQLADKEFKTLLLTESNYFGITKEEIEKLIKLIPSINEKHLVLAINNNRLEAVEILLKNYPYINLNTPIALLKNKTILELSYEKKYLSIFKFLLKAGAFCNKLDADGQTLLMKACLDEREEEMVALLAAGASNFIRDKLGYTAFAFLTMSEKMQPDLILVALFIKNCQKFLIDFMQGPYSKRGTPLSFACQNNWIMAAGLLITSGANPAILRESDYLSALDICAGKNHTEILNIILEQCKKDAIIFGCNKALKVAEQFKQPACVKLLKDYIEKNNISADENRLLVGIGTSTATLPKSFFKQPDECKEISEHLRQIFDLINSSRNIIPSSSKEEEEEEEEEEKNPLQFN